MVDFTTIYKKIRIKQLAIALMVTLLLGACSDSAPNPVCVGSDDLGNSTTKNTLVEATNDGWVNSGITVESGKKLTIKSIGSVYLCQSEGVVEEMHTFTPVSTNGEWQDSGIVIKKNYKYTFDVSGAYTLWSGPYSVPAGDKYIDTDGYLRQGRGLFAYIGNTALAGVEVGTEVQDDSENLDSFFEMYRRDTQSSIDENGTAITIPKPSSVMPNNIGYGITNIPYEGKLWFRYRDYIPGDINVSNSFIISSYYGDNRGAYTVTVKRYGPCYGTNGKYTKASIGDSGGEGTVINVSDCSVASDSPPGDPADDVCSNGTYSTLSSPASGKVWLKINDSDGNDGDGDYSPYIAPVIDSETGEVTVPASGSNSGAYSVSVTTVKAEDKTFSNLVNNIVDPIRELLLGVKAHGDVPAKDGLTKTMYNNLTANGAFIQGVRALMALSIVLFAFQFMTGITSITHREFFNLSLKMAFIITMIGPTSWDFFSTYLFAFFISGTDNLIWIMSNNINELVVSTTPTMIVEATGNAGSDQGRSVFGFLNNTLTILFSKESNIKLQALFVSFPIGPALAGIMYVGIFFFLFALIKAILSYLIAIIMTALLIFMAPIFICFILFERTKTIFDKWLRQLVGYSLQPIFIFMVLAIFNVFIILSLYSILNFTACYSCIFTMDLPFSEIIGGGTDFDSFCAMHGYLPWGVDSSQDTATKLAKTPVGLLYVLIFVILANVMVTFLDWIEILANSLTGSPAAGGATLGSGAQGMLNEATAIGKTTGGMAVGSVKFAGSYGAKAANMATFGVAGRIGTSVSDSAKKTVRNALPKSLTGGKDRTGEHVMKTSLMTSKEKKGYERSLREFDKLDDFEQQAVKDMNRDRRDIDKVTKGGNRGISGRLSGRAEKQAYKMNKEARLREFEKLGSMKKKGAKEAIRGGAFKRKDLNAYADLGGGREAKKERGEILKRTSERSDAARKQYAEDAPLEAAAKRNATGLDALRSGRDILDNQKTAQGYDNIIQKRENEEKAPGEKRGLTVTENMRGYIPIVGKKILAGKIAKDQKQESKMTGLRRTLDESGEKITTWDRLMAFGNEDRAVENKAMGIINKAIQTEKETMRFETDDGRSIEVRNGKVTGVKDIEKPE